MPTAILVVRLALAAVFLTAGVSKLADRAAFRETVAAFGVPVRLTRPVAVVVPLAEVAVAAALLPAASARIAAVAALVLLVLFIGAILLTLARGQAPDCRCFGQISNRPISGKTVARNAILVALAASIAFSGRTGTSAGATGWIGNLTAAGWVVVVVGFGLVAAVAVEGWLILNLLRQQGRLLMRIEALETGRPVPAAARMDAAPAAAGLPVGSAAPAFALPDLDGDLVSLDALRSSGLPVLLLFTDPGCGPCTSLLPEVGRWQADFADALVVAVLSRGDLAVNRRRAADAGVVTVLLQRDHEVAEAYRFVGTPGGVLVDPDGTVASPVVAGADPIRKLVLDRVAVQAGRMTREDEIALSGLGQRGLGQPVPAFSLADLDGRLVDSSHFRGRETLLLFWNPECGHCQAMLPELKRWEQHARSAAPQLVVISSGSAEANRAMGLRSPVLLDPTFSVGAAFGAAGTPMAVLLDASGAAASGLAQGAQAVLELARGRQSVRAAAR